MGITKPMLAGKCSDTSNLPYPVLCTPKLDGVRALVVDGKLVTRTFKDFPNSYIRAIGSALPEGFDGEIIMEGKPFSEITHDVMREDGEPDFVYAVFDIYSDDGYAKRMERLAKCGKYKHVKYILPVEINSEQELLEYEQNCLASGYEGVMIRSPDGPYKFGRSSEREGYLLKLKRFQDSEAEILELVEKMNNDNVAERDAFGRSKRSSGKDGLTPAGTLGAFKVRDIKTGVEFSIGSGFDDAFRAEVWANQKEYVGKIIKYSSQKIGAKDAPRFPVFLGVRDKNDL